MARRTTTSRIELEVTQREARNRAQFRRIERWARETQRTMEGVATAARGVIIGITGFFAVAIKMYAEQEVAERKMAGALKATGQEVGRLTKKYNQLASDIQAVTTFGEEGLLEAGSILTRLATISEEQMPRILELTADWAAFLGKDVNSAARDVGRVMADPVRNLSLLGRYGVQVTDELKAGLAALIATGRVEEARLVVWQELNKVVGGAARELASVETGKWIQLKNTVGDLLELFGKRLVERLQPLRLWLIGLLDQFAANADQVKQLVDLLIKGLMYAFSLLITSKIVAFLALVTTAIYRMRTAAGRAAFAFRAMWGAATFGIAIAVPFIIENLDKISRVLNLAGGELGTALGARQLTSGQQKIGRAGAGHVSPVDALDPADGSPQPDTKAPVADDWWSKVQAAWTGEGLGGGESEGEGEDLSEEVRRIASGALTAEELLAITEEYAAAEEERTAGLKAAEEERTARKREPRH